MTTQSKAQEAALLRVKQIRAGFRESISAPLKYRIKVHTLDSLEKQFDEHLREIAKLVEEHSLDQSIVTDFRNEMLHVIFEEAGSREDHAWQARFAKTYGL